MDIKRYFVDRLYERTSGVPLLVQRVLVWFTRDKPQEILQSIRAVDEFFVQDVPKQLRTSDADLEIFSPLKSLSTQSLTLQHFYLKLLSLAYFKIPIERTTSLRMDLIGLGDLRNEVDIVEAVDITGFYLQDEGDHSFVVVPPYCLMLMHDIAQFVAPFIPRSFLGANSQVLDPGRTLERMTRMALKTLFSSYASTTRKYGSIPWLSETCIAQLPIQALSEEEISLPKLIGVNDLPKNAVALAGNKTIQDQRRKLENGEQCSQCHWYCFDLINAMLIKDNTLCYSKDKSHGADEQIRLFDKYHIFFQDKNLFSSVLTAKMVLEEADKVYKSISRLSGAQAILVLIPLTVGQELQQKAATKSGYLYCAPNSRLCGYVLPDLHVVVLLEESLRAFLGGSNVDILRQIRKQEHVPFDQAFNVEAPYLQQPSPSPSPSPSPKRVTIFDGTKSSAGGKVIVFHEKDTDWTKFIQMCVHKLNLATDEPEKQQAKVFLESGGEVDSLECIRDNDTLKIHIM